MRCLLHGAAAGAFLSGVPLLAQAEWVGEPLVRGAVDLVLTPRTIAPLLAATLIATVAGIRAKRWRPWATLALTSGTAGYLVALVLACHCVYATRMMSGDLGWAVTLDNLERVKPIIAANLGLGGLSALAGLLGGGVIRLRAPRAPA